MPTNGDSLISRDVFNEFCNSDWPQKLGWCAVFAKSQKLEHQAAIGIAESLIMLSDPNERAVLEKMGIVDYNVESLKWVKTPYPYKLTGAGQEIMYACESVFVDPKVLKYS